MPTTVLIIPMEEITEHLSSNTRQDLKLVAPELLTEPLYQLLVARGKNVKREEALVENVWRHSGPGQPNRLCESSSFCMGARQPDGPFALSVANEKAEQDEHYHAQHVEIYFSEHSMGATFREPGEGAVQSVDLREGGIFVFGPGVAHKMRLGGFTVVIEVPGVRNDKLVLQAHGSGGCGG